MLAFKKYFGGAVAQLGARLDGIEEVVGSNPISSTKIRCARERVPVKTGKVVGSKPISSTKNTFSTLKFPPLASSFAQSHASGHPGKKDS